MAKGRGRQDVRGRSLLKRDEEEAGHCSGIPLNCDGIINLSGSVCVLAMMCSYLLLSFKVLQLISSMSTIIRGTMWGQQGSGSNWVEYLQRITTWVRQRHVLFTMHTTSPLYFSIHLPYCDKTNLII